MDDYHLPILEVDRTTEEQIEMHCSCGRYGVSYGGNVGWKLLVKTALEKFQYHLNEVTREYGEYGASSQH